MSNEATISNPIATKIVSSAIMFFLVIACITIAEETALSQACDRAKDYAIMSESLRSVTGPLSQGRVKTDYRWFDGCYVMINTSDHYFVVDKIF